VKRTPLATLGLAAGLVVAAVASYGARATASGTQTVQVRMHFSKFEPGAITVPAGKPIRFVIHNSDFIDHEFIVGDDDVQRRHETGTEPHHGARPTEVDVPAGTDVATVITFPRSATLVYACHAPGHFAYGMHGVLTVR
jgi:uncharacterized cupredoxin-like copper-binding protein